MRLLTIEGLHAFYERVPALFDIDMEFRSGGVTAILGANGAGKTTLLRSICGMVRTEGKIHFENARIDKLATEDIVRLGIAHVPDGRGTFVNMSVEENLRLGGYIKRDRKLMLRDCDRMYDLFPRLRERRAQKAGLLSGGEQQMLAISRALMLSPRALLLDEPSFGLSPLMVREIFSTFRSLTETEGVTIVLVEQNASLALEVAEYGYLLETGRVVRHGPSAALRADPTIIRSYLGLATS